MSEYYFWTENLTVGYDRKPLIHDITLGIRKGEIVTLIGPNGAGKSTILKTITRQIPEISGRMYLDGRVLGAISGKELATKMAVVLTDRIHPELMTCRDVVATGRYPYTGRLGILSRKDEEKVEEAMKLVHAEEIGERDFGAISDGQRQRVLLARAICQEPELIVLDEPTSFLDIRYKLELLSILRTMARERQITVILSLHEIDLAQKISDRIICVKGDTIAGFGTPAEVFGERTIRDLYEIDNGFFDPLFGSVELSRQEGPPEVFVISNCGKGIPVYRQLQKEHIPFSAGILPTNDLDYHLARLLAVKVISSEPFDGITDAAYEQALEEIHACKRVIVADPVIGEHNQRLAGLIKEAERCGKK